jgi:hypothetical protein
MRKSDERIQEAWEDLFHRMDLEVLVKEYMEELEYQNKYGGLFHTINLPKPKGWRARLKSWLRQWITRRTEYPVLDYWPWE